VFFGEEFVYYVVGVFLCVVFGLFVGFVELLCVYG